MRSLLTTCALFLMGSSDAALGGVETGMMLRLEEKTLRHLTQNLDQFLPHYLTYDFKIDDTMKYDWKMLFGLIDWKFNWKNITYLQPTFDMTDFVVKFDTFLPNVQDGVKMIKLDFPGIKFWEMRANQHTNILFLPQDSRVVLRLKEIDFKMNF